MRYLALFVITSSEPISELDLALRNSLVVSVESRQAFSIWTGGFSFRSRQDICGERLMVLLIVAERRETAMTVSAIRKTEATMFEIPFLFVFMDFIL